MPAGTARTEPNTSAKVCFMQVFIVLIAQGQVWRCMEQAYEIERCVCHVPGTRDKVANRQMTATAAGQQRAAQVAAEVAAKVEATAAAGAAAGAVAGGGRGRGQLQIAMCVNSHTAAPRPGYKVSPDRRQTTAMLVIFNVCLVNAWSAGKGGKESGLRLHFLCAHS